MGKGKEEEKERLVGSLMFLKKGHRRMSNWEATSLESPEQLAILVVLEKGEESEQQQQQVNE